MKKKVKPQTIKVSMEVPRENVLTLKEVADKLKKSCGWKRVSVNSVLGVVFFTYDNKEYILAAESGNVYAGYPIGSSKLIVDHLDIGEELDFCQNIVWARDDNGNLLAVEIF